MSSHGSADKPFILWFLSLQLKRWELAVRKTNFIAKLCVDMCYTVY